MQVENSLSFMYISNRFELRRFSKKIFFLFVSLFLFIGCSNQRAESVENRHYTSAELIGQWTQVNHDNFFNCLNPKIKFIKFVNDSIVVIRLSEPTGERTILGKWENGFKKEIKVLKVMQLEIISDVKISYQTDDHHLNWLVMKVGEAKGKTIMTTLNLKFVKE
jgi:hypothetical protein